MNEVMEKEVTEKIKEQIISEVFINDEITLTEKIKFYQELTDLAKNWYELLFKIRWETEQEKRKIDQDLENIKKNLKNKHHQL